VCWCDASSSRNLLVYCASAEAAAVVEAAVAAVAMMAIHLQHHQQIMRLHSQQLALLQLPRIQLLLEQLQLQMQIMIL